MWKRGCRLARMGKEEVDRRVEGGWWRVIHYQRREETRQCGRCLMERCGNTQLGQIMS